MLKNYETAAIKISPAELTKDIMRSSSAQTIERLKTEQVEQRKKSFDKDNRKE